MADLDAELAELQAELQRVQLSTASHKLSERNVVELVSKLIELGKIEVFYTFNKEYITPAQLAREIKAEIRSHGGRINIRDLQTIINIDQSHVETTVNELAGEDSSIHVLPGGEVVTEGYLDDLAEDTNALLQQQGQLPLGQVSVDAQLPLQFTTAAVESRLGILLNAELRQGVLMTSAYVALQQSRLRGIIHAVTKPVQLSQVVEMFSLDAEICHQTLRDDVATGALAGSLKGDTYTPYIFAATQRKGVEQFFSTNRYIPKDRAAQLGVVGGVRDYLLTSFPNLVDLPSCVVDESIVGMVHSAIEECVLSKSHVDVEAVAAFPHTAADLDKVVSQCKWVGGEWAPGQRRKPNEPQGLVLAAHVVASFGLLDTVYARCEEEVHAAVNRKHTPAGAAATSSGAGQGSGEGSPQAASDEEGYVMISRGSSQLAEGIAAATSSREVNADAVTQSLQAWEATCELEPSVMEALAAVMVPFVLAAFKEADAAAGAGVLHGEARARRRTQAALVTRMGEGYHRLLMHAAAYDQVCRRSSKIQAEDAADVPRMVARLQWHLMVSEAEPLVTDMLTHQCTVHDIVVPDDVDLSDVNRRKQLAQQLVKATGGGEESSKKEESGGKRGKKSRSGGRGDRGGGKQKRGRKGREVSDDEDEGDDEEVLSPARAVLDAVAASKPRGDVAMFIKRFEVAAKLAMLRLPKWDKRVSRNQIHAESQRLASQLRLAGSGAQVLRFTSLSLWHDATSTILSLPEDFSDAALLLQLLRAHLAPAAFSELLQFEESVRGCEGGDEGAATPALSRQDSAQSVQDGIEEVRALGLAPRSARKQRGQSS